MIKIVNSFKKNGYVKLKLFNKNEISLIKNLVLFKLNKIYNLGFYDIKNFHNFSLSKSIHSKLLNPSTRYIDFDLFKNKFPNYKKKTNLFFRNYWGRCKTEVYWVGSLKKKQIKKNKVGFRLVRPSNFNEGGVEHTDSYSKYLDSFVTIWIPLVGFDSKYTLRYSKKSHLIEHPKVKQVKQKKYISKALDKKYIKKFKFIRPKMQIGDAIIHHPNILHGASPNLGKVTRVSIEIRIFNTDKYKKSQLFNKSYYY